MNIIIFQTIRAGVVLGVALFAFAGDVFAAPVLNPVTVSQVASDSATLVGHISNPGKTSKVWFESGEDPLLSAPAVVGMNAVYNEGFFQGYLTTLTPGTKYYYRAATVDNGVTIYSPIFSFKTLGSGPSSAATQSSSVSQSAESSGNTNQTQTKTQTSNTNSKSANNTAVANAAKKTTSAAVLAGSNAYTSVSGTNSNSAAVVGAGNSIFPSTLIGWVLLLLSIVAAVLVGRMIFESSDKGKKLA